MAVPVGIQTQSVTPHKGYQRPDNPVIAQDLLSLAMPTIKVLEVPTGTSRLIAKSVLRPHAQKLRFAR
jgi:hypothetical protein